MRLQPHLWMLYMYSTISVIERQAYLAMLLTRGPATPRLLLANMDATTNNTTTTTTTTYWLEH